MDITIGIQELDLIYDVEVVVPITISIHVYGDSPLSIWKKSTWFHNILYSTPLFLLLSPLTYILMHSSVHFPLIFFLSWPRKYMGGT